jgi:hypothetical protein
MRSARTVNRHTTAIFLALGLSWATFQPALAQQRATVYDPDVKANQKTRKKKKSQPKKEKADNDRIILPAQIFSNAANQTSGANSAPAASERSAQHKQKTGRPIALPPAQAGVTYRPVTRGIDSFATVDFSELAKKESLSPKIAAEAEIEEAEPNGAPPRGDRGVPIVFPSSDLGAPAVAAPTPSSTGISPPPTNVMKAEFLSGTSIPPDTIGAVGTTHIVVPSNNMLRIMDRNGVELSRVTTNSFWAGTTVKGNPVTSAFDPKVYFDRFNNRFFFIVSLNGPTVNSGLGLAVTQTADPTGVWNRYTAPCDPAASPTRAIDYPSVGHNKNWIVVNENTFNFTGPSFTTYWGPQIFVFDKAAAYAGTLSSFSLFEDPVTNCVSPFNGILGCGFTMAPAITEDNTTTTEYLIEDWDSTAAQLRLTKLTGTVSTPVITVGTQFPQSTFSWRFNALRLASAGAGTSGASGGYMPQRQQSADLVSGTRVMANDSRIQNAVFRGGTLWTTHTVMVASTPTLAGTCVGGTALCGVATAVDNHSDIQWWAIDPTIETGLSTPPIQRARIDDATADNCNDGNGLNRATAPCNNNTLNQVGTFFAFPNISVNTNKDVLISFSQLSAFTYPSGGYAVRRSSDAVNTMRDPVIYRPGQSNYNIGAGSGTGRQNRWGDYSEAQTDPLNDTDFWMVTEYSGLRKDFGIGIAAPWETYIAQVNPAAAAPSTSGGLLISEFRLRGPQGVRDEFVEVYNPSNSPLYVRATDNSDGWALATNNGATTTVLAVIPNGTVIPARGHLLFTDAPDVAGTDVTTYSLNSYPGKSNPASTLRGADGDIGWGVDVVDTAGLALFKTALSANFSVATLMDAAGPATLPAGSLFKEGTGFGALPTSNLQYTMFRRFGSGVPVDSNNNATDFTFADTAGTITSAGQNLGAPGPENLESPIQRNPGFGAFRLDQSVLSSSAPNRVRDFTADPGNNSTFGTLTIRNRVVNNTGGPITRLRFRVVSLTTFPAPSGIADLRLRTSIDTLNVSVNDPATCGGPAPCLVTVKGLTLETPPAQSASAATNSTVTAGFITLGTPLANGASANIQFLLGVQQAGSFRFFLNVEALP